MGMSEQTANELADELTSGSLLQPTFWETREACAAMLRVQAAQIAAKDEKIDELEATLDDEETAHQDSLRLLAAKDKRIAELEAKLTAWRERVGDV